MHSSNAGCFERDKISFHACRQSGILRTPVRSMGCLQMQTAAATSDESSQLMLSDEMKYSASGRPEMAWRFARLSRRSFDFTCSAPPSHYVPASQYNPRRNKTIVKCDGGFLRHHRCCLHNLTSRSQDTLVGFLPPSPTFLLSQDTPRQRCNTPSLHPTIVPQSCVRLSRLLVSTTTALHHQRCTSRRQILAHRRAKSYKKSRLRNIPSTSSRAQHSPWPSQASSSSAGGYSRLSCLFRPSEC